MLTSAHRSHKESDRGARRRREQRPKHERILREISPFSQSSGNSGANNN